MENRVSVEEAAERLHVNKDTIRAGLISQRFKFGEAVMCNKNYSYIIPRRRFEMWLSGEDMKPIIALQRQHEAAN